MEKGLRDHLDQIFAPYGSVDRIKELKEELYAHLTEKLGDLKKDGYDDEDAFNLTIASLEGVSEIVESMNENVNQLAQFATLRFTGSNLKNSDFSSIKAPQKKFDYSNLEGSNFSHSDLQGCSFKGSNVTNSVFEGSDLRNSSFRGSNLTNVNFEGSNLSGAKLQSSNLKGASLSGCLLDNADFSRSNLSGLSFDGLSLSGTAFDNANLRGASFRNTRLFGVSFRTDAKKTVFTGAVMDKLTYAILKGHRADLTGVTVE